METQEPIVVRKRTVACDGGGRLGHPRVYLRLDDRGSAVCPYCSCRFVLARDVVDGTAH